MVVKLTDFGLARTSDDLDARMRTGTTIGTVDYISRKPATAARPISAISIPLAARSITCWLAGLRFPRD